MDQPKAFESVDHPEYVYKLKKTLYGLKKTLKTCKLIYAKSEEDSLGSCVADPKEANDGVAINNRNKISSRVVTAKENTWLKQLLEDLHQSADYAIPLHCDNLTAIRLAEDPIFHAITNRPPQAARLLLVAQASDFRPPSSAARRPLVAQPDLLRPHLLRPPTSPRSTSASSSQDTRRSSTAHLPDLIFSGTS
ncbi:hypothetical protein AKJ16_DCAP25178 [Drosera capensis]